MSPGRILVRCGKKRFGVLQRLYLLSDASFILFSGIEKGENPIKLLIYKIAFDKKAVFIYSCQVSYSCQVFWFEDYGPIV